MHGYYVIPKLNNYDCKDVTEPEPELGRTPRVTTQPRRVVRNVFAMFSPRSNQTIIQSIPSPQQPQESSRGAGFVAPTILDRAGSHALAELEANDQVARDAMFMELPNDDDDDDVDSEDEDF